MGGKIEVVAGVAGIITGICCVVDSDPREFVTVNVTGYVFKGFVCVGNTCVGL